MGGQLAGNNYWVEELTPDGTSRWKKENKALGAAVPGSFRDGAVPAHPHIDAPNAIVFASTALIPMVGDWLAEEDDRIATSTFSVPHSAEWLKHTYDPEYQRRHELRLVRAAGSAHPLDRQLAVLTIPLDGLPVAARAQITQIVPSWQTLTTNQTSAQTSIATLLLSCDGSAFCQPQPAFLGAAVSFISPSHELSTTKDTAPPARTALFSRIPCCTDTSIPTNGLAQLAEMAAAALALRVAGAYAGTAQQALIHTDCDAVIKTLVRLPHLPLGRKRLVNNADFSINNQMVAYGRLQFINGQCLPRVHPKKVLGHDDSNTSGEPTVANHLCDTLD